MAKVSYVVKGFPHELQKRAAGSFCTAPHDPHDNPARRFAPHAEQNVDEGLLAAPQVPQRPGKGGT